ncbi:MAG: heme o synthase [Chloroflexota bacterium]|nr:heme o synthase [Chloroflexota bacterium]
MSMLTSRAHRDPGTRSRRFAISLPILAAATLGTAWAEIFWGGVVRLSKSGLGCADNWPLCNGKVYPFWEQPVLIEYIHRLIALLISVLVATLLVVIWRTQRRNGWLFGPALLAVALFIVQALLGAIVVWFSLKSGLVMVHLATSMLLLATLGVLTVHAFPRPVPARGARLVGFDRFPALALGATIFAYIVLLSGAYTTSQHAGAACTTWPLCNGRLVPLDGTLFVTGVQMVHRLFAYALALILIPLYLRARRNKAIFPLFARLTGIACGLVLLQITIGVVQVVNLLPGWLVSLHIGNAAALFATLVLTTTFAFRTCATTMASDSGISMSGDSEADVPAHREEREPSLASLYFKLTRPRVIPLLLITTLCAMLVATKGVPSFGLIVVTLLAGALMAGGAHAINAYIDRDIDQEMKRTRTRPVVTGAIPPRNALFFGIALGAVGFAFYLVFVNVLSALLGLAGLLFYVYVYSLWLKRRTVQNIVIGGAAGAFPPLVGWAAVTNHLSFAALVLFAIIFLWTPPHFWALAILIRKDYEGVGIPMLPVVIGEERTARHIAAYTVVLIVVTLLLAIGQVMGTLYIAVALLLGAGFLYYVGRLLKETNKASAKRVFVYSNLYLALLFLGMVLDHALR